jgi:Zn finger protein HypA/HybF involved in hydrogenase expression
MHEAGLASTIALRLWEAREAGVLGPPRIIVKGGHEEPADFDAALRLHLALVAPDLDGEALEFVHVPVTRMCSGCGRQFSADRPLALCPTCGSGALPGPTHEEIELDWADGKGG